MEKAAATAMETERKESSNGSHLEHTLTHIDQQQDEEYRLGWKSFLAITALALGNSCAALTNTVCSTAPK